MSNFEYHDKWKNPETGRFCSHVYLLNGKRVTGVTTVLGVLAKPALIQWASDMAVGYVRDNSASTTGDTGDKIYSVLDSVLDEARVAHCKKKEAAGEKGTDVHALVEEWITYQIAHPEETGSWGNNDPMLVMFINWAKQNGVKFLASEKKVYSEEWFVAGTFDFSFEKDGKRFIGDLKTMGKIWDNVPHWQAAAYRKMSVEMGEPDYDGTCIVNISKPSDKYPSKLTESWSYDFEGDQKAFEACLTLYRKLNN